MRNTGTSIKWSRSLVQVKTSQILTIQDLRLKTIMLGPLWTELPKLFGLFFLFILVFPISKAC